MWSTIAVDAAAGPTIEQMVAAPWRPLTTADRADLGEVSVLTAQVAGIDCFRGVADTDVAASELFEVILDIGSVPRWSTTGVTGGGVLQRTAASLVYHQYLDVPGWTMSADRYWYLQGRIFTTPARYELSWDRLPAGSPWLAQRDAFAAAHPDAVEPPVNVGSWVLEATPGGTHITYSVCTQSGGNIPVALQNAASRRTLPDNLADVVREARRR